MDYLMEDRGPSEVGERKVKSTGVLAILHDPKQASSSEAGR